MQCYVAGGSQQHLMQCYKAYDTFVSFQPLVVSVYLLAFFFLLGVAPSVVSVASVVSSSTFWYKRTWLASTALELVRTGTFSVP